MMKIKIHKPASIFVLVCFMICIQFMTGRAQVLPVLENNFVNYQKTNLQEKLYVHTDKSFYLTGELLWFKIYNTDGATNKLLDLSKVVYVELLDNKQIPVLQAKIAMNGGTGNGSFYIPFSLSNGSYHLRAYTSWMKNFDQGYYFEKQITIVNPIKISPPQPKLATQVYDVQFLPEGGHLVKGLDSKVAFKLTGQDGKGADCTGAVIGPQNDTIVRFKSLKFGIGNFSFKPSEQTGYKVIIKTRNTVITKTLPEISAAGYVIRASDHGESLEVFVQNSDRNSSEKVYLLVHNRHAIKQAEAVNLANGDAHFNISKSKLDGGISYITLFDEKQRPLCERMIFKRPERKLLINATTDNTSYSNRHQVNLAITTRDHLNKNLPANLSVAVYRLDSLQKEHAAHIAAYLWLSADIKGNIESPDYYIENDNEEGNHALDNLMLSQGWTQYDWSKILTGEKPRFTFLPEYTGPIVTAKIVNTETSQPAGNITAYLTVLGDHHQLYVSKSDLNGQLLFNTKSFYGSNELFVQTNWKQDSTYRIDVTNPFSEQYGKESLSSFNLNADIKNVLIKSSVDMQAQNIFWTKQMKRFNHPVTDSVMFYDKPSFTYLLDDYTRFPTFEDVIHEYIRLVHLTKNNDKMGLEVSDGKVASLGIPLVLIDGRPVFDIDKIFEVDPLKVKRLDVVTTDYIYGPAIFHGILNFRTYNNQSSNMELDPHTVVLDYEGLQMDRQFYSPVYDSDQQINSPVPDFRNVLYWNPEADTDTQGQNKLSFYTGDRPGRYIGIIEGISPGGEAGSQYFYFEVKK